MVGQPLGYDDLTQRGKDVVDVVKKDYEGDTYFPAWSDAEWEITRTADHARFEFRVYERMPLRNMGTD